MSLTGKAIAYLKEQFPNVSFLKDIILQDDGNGPYIKYWGIGSSQPTEEEINQAAESMVEKVLPPTAEELFQLLYNDQKNNTKTFSERIDAIGTNVK